MDLSSQVDVYKNRPSEPNGRIVSAKKPIFRHHCGSKMANGLFITPSIAIMTSFIVIAVDIGRSCLV